MSRFDAPTRERVPVESQEIFDQTQQEFGTVPDLYGDLGLSPVARRGPLRFQPALGESSLQPPEVQALHLATSQENGCDDCPAAHTVPGAMTISIRVHDAVDFPMDFPETPALEAATR
jgi:alkylhydroperoxidase family enzyme